MSIKVLSLFDGIAGARQALKNLDIDCDYYAVEIDRFAYHIAKSNHPDIYHLSNGYLGDVRDFLSEEYEKIPHDLQKAINYTRDKKMFIDEDVDLLIGGSPCQDLSVAKRNAKGLNGERSGLFFEYLRILNKVKPKYFILENVASMKAKDRDIISQHLGVQPTMIDSQLLTAQQRKRLYWVGKLIGDKYKQVEIRQPEDKKIFLKDILEDGDTERLKAYCLTATYSRACLEDYFYHSQRQIIWKGCALRGRHIVNGKRKDIRGSKTEQRIEIRGDNKVNCLTTVNKDSLIISKDMMRKLTVIECERLQGFPDNYCDMVSKTQAYKALGNSFTVPVIEHLIKNICL